MEEPRRLGDRYEIGPVLGRGGMAEVHTARDQRLGRTVAVKMLRVDLARDPTFQARFRREAQSAASLNHPSIVAVYDTGEDIINGLSLPYIVMEFVDGSTLRELMQNGRRLLPERTMEITAGVLHALEYSHRNGIIHRDIKPGNVMLTRAGAVKVMDFGIARAVADTSATMTQTAAVIGTAQYLSPEQARGEPVDARSDLYSTGCLLYELLTGRPPFLGDSPVSVAYQHVREEPQPPSVHDAEVTPEMDRIVLKSLAKSPENRYQSADEFRADLERALDGQPVAAPAVMSHATQRIPAMASTSMFEPVVDHRAGARPDERRKTGGYVLLAVAVIAVFLGALMVGKLLFTNNNGGGTVTVPALTGMTKADATVALEAKHLAFLFQSRPDDTQPSGKVADQDPKPNATAHSGDTVTVWLSTGPAQATTTATPSATPSNTPTPSDTPTPDLVPVPDVIGRSQADAEQAMRQKHLNPQVQRVQSDQPPGVVVQTNPDANAKVQPNSTVTLLVSSGPQTQQPQTVAVPQVVDASVADAKQALKQAGLNVTVVRQDVPGAQPDTVIGSDPKPGTQVPVGTTVTLFASRKDGGGNGGGNG